MFAKLLKKYRKKENLTQNEIAILLSQIIGKDITGDNIRSYEGNTNPKLDVIEALALILKIPVQFLFDDSEYALSQFSNIDMAQDIKKVPLIHGYAGAGSGGIVNEINIKEFIYIDANSIKKSYKNREDIRAIEVIGDSMTPYVNCSDLVLFSPVEKGKYNFSDGKYVIETINGIMVKNLSFKTNGNIIISSSNNSYLPEEINMKETQESLEIIGTVVGRILKS